MAEPTIDTGDCVFHAPTGETWLVAYVKGDRLAWLGWPWGEAALSDCTLTEKATEEKRQEHMRLMLDSSRAEFREHAKEATDG